MFAPLRVMPSNEVLYGERIGIKETASNVKAPAPRSWKLTYYLEDLVTEPPPAGE